MTITGEMTKKQQLTLRFVSAGTCLGIIGFFVGFTVIALRAEQRWAGAGVQFVTLALVAALAALAISLQLWYDHRTIVEFTCDESSLKFRRLGTGRAETRRLSEISAVDQCSGHSGSVGYQLIFVEGTQAHVRHSVSNAALLLEWLRDRGK